ncbi:hypothetical protein SAY86_025306 [Trapa natans]|uniref:Uncharacterized protein n=1 Tax=Trapa natans TaxID=22666 RepID=A0AAN7MRU8_TRANT|nr:hypothetical protein SAY86_025306 [Trapa natans]
MLTSFLTHHINSCRYAVKLFLLCLLHLTMQIIVTYAGKYEFEKGDYSYICLISAIAKLMSDSKCVDKCFVSNYTDYSSNVRDTIRSFTFLYLRRCALLWNLVYSSTGIIFWHGLPIRYIFQR